MGRPKAPPKVECAVRNPSKINLRVRFRLARGGEWDGTSYVEITGKPKQRPDGTWWADMRHVSRLSPEGVEHPSSLSDMGVVPYEDRTWNPTWSLVEISKKE